MKCIQSLDLICEDVCRVILSYWFVIDDQSYIPKSLDDVNNPEADVAKITSGQDTGDMLYQTITGLKDALPKVEEQQIEVDAEEEEEEKEEEDGGSEEGSEEESEEELGPEDKKAARKEHKKKVKEEKRESRKTKTPKSVKKRKKKVSKPKKTR